MTYPKPFLVIAADPENEERLARVDVEEALSEDDARWKARAELAKTKRDHWSIRLVRERSVA